MDKEAVSYEDVLDAPPGLEADPTESESICTEDQSYRETVCVVRSYMKWSFIPELEYVCPSRQDNPWTGKVSVCMPADDWFCSKIEQMNLHLLQGHENNALPAIVLSFNLLLDRLSSPKGATLLLTTGYCCLHTFFSTIIYTCLSTTLHIFNTHWVIRRDC